MPEFHLRNHQLRTILISYHIIIISLLFYNTGYLDVALLPKGFRAVLILGYLLFVPGYLFLTGLNVDRENSLDTVLMSVSFSIVYIMVVGGLASVFYPLIGVDRPLSKFAIAAIILPSTFLATILYVPEVQDVRFRIDKIDVSLFVLIPTLMILANVVYDQFNTDTGIILVFFLIAGVYLSAVRGYIPQSSYSYAVAAFSIALPLVPMLAKSFIIRGDKSKVYVLASHTREVLSWNPEIPVKYTTSFSMTVLPTIYSTFTGLPITDIFEYIIPGIVMFLPVVVFALSEQAFDKEVALGSSVLYIFAVINMNIIASGVKQGFANLFIAYIFYLTVVNRGQRVLFLILSVSLIFVHYGTPYIFLLIVMGTVTVKYLDRYIRKLFDYSNRYITNSSFSVMYISLFAAVLVAWHIYIASGQLFLQVNSIIYEDVYLSIQNFLFISEETATRQANRSLLTFSMQALRYYYIFFIAISGVGVLTEYYRSLTIESYNRFDILYVAIAILGFWGIITVVPTGTPIDVLRVFSITFIVLSPFAIQGLRSGFSIFDRVLRNVTEDQVPVRTLVAMVIVGFFLIGTGIPPEVTGEYQYNIPLAQMNNEELSVENEPMSFTARGGQTSDVYAATWLNQHRSVDFPVYADIQSKPILRVYYGTSGATYDSIRLSGKNPPIKLLFPSRTSKSFNSNFQSEQNYYVFMREYTISSGRLSRPGLRFSRGYSRMYFDASDIILQIETRSSKVYDSNAAVYWNSSGDP